MITDDHLTRFSQLFKGYHLAYGQYAISKNSEKGTKTLGKPWTVGHEIDDLTWRHHLDGTGPGLGIILLQANNTCRFGAIDIDDYLVDHGQLCRKIGTLGLPLVVCRTKSGGAHLYIFFSEDVPAALLRDRLSEWCAALGYSAKTEQFPKQISRADDTEIGNWLNIPYYAAERTLRCGYDAAGGPLSFFDFLTFAESKQVDVAYMSKPFYAPAGEDDLFYEGPPCLIALQAQGGFAEGTRNDGMFAVGVYCRKRFGDEGWEARMEEYNKVMANLPAKELIGLQKSIGKKVYAYPCKRSPINAVCQRRICLGREYGVGDGSASARVEILSVIRYDHIADDPLWSFEINGKRVMVGNEDFYSKDAMNKACMAQAGCVPLHMPQAKWLFTLNELVQSADIVPMPNDASPNGQLWERIEMFLQQGVNALSKEEIQTGKIFRDDQGCHFRGIDLFSYLDARHVKYRNEQFVWQLLRDHGATSTTWWFGKKNATPSVSPSAGVAGKVWSIPFTAQTAESEADPPELGMMNEF